jgi:hypothetical protein
MAACLSAVTQRVVVAEVRAAKLGRVWRVVLIVYAAS